MRVDAVIQWRVSVSKLRLALRDMPIFPFVSDIACEKYERNATCIACYSAVVDTTLS